MSRPESARRWLPAGALVLVVALLCVFIWLRGSNGGDAPVVGMPSKAAGPTPSEKGTSVEPVDEAHPRREASTTPEPTGPGSLRIHVVDAVTNAAIVGAKGLVEAASDDAHDHGSFETDSDGRATVGDLPATTLVVHVLRRPPHASGYAAVEMHAGESHNVELRLTAGGTLVGRAVDDAGKEVPDAEVSLSSERDDILTIGAPQTWELIGKTGADGRFEIAHVLSRPIRVSVVDGELRAQFWSSVSVRVQSGLAQGYAQQTVTDGARTDVGDILLPRARALSGRVLDAHRAPVEGALVEPTNWGVDLKWGPIPARAVPAAAVLGDDKALTKVDGSFSVKANAGAKYVSVTTKSSIFEQFALPDAKSAPTEPVLVLKDWSILELELVDEQGARISAASPRMQDRRVRWISAAREVWGETGALDATLVLDGKREIHEHFVADADGLFRFQTTDTAGAERRLHFELQGYSPVDAAIGAQTEFVDHRKFTLHLVPTMHAHVNIAAQPEPKPGARMQLLVQACMLDPTQFMAHNEFAGTRCCGQGSVFTAPLQAGEYDVELPVLAKGDYWLHATVPGVQRDEKGAMVPAVAFEVHIGPFPTDDARHEIEVPAVEPMQIDDDPVATMPASSVGSTSVTGRIIDAVTQKGIGFAMIRMSLVPNPRAPIGDANLGVDQDGNVKKHALHCGTYSMSVVARTYHVPPTRDVTIVDGQTLDLGTLALDPIPTTTLHMSEADGRPVPRGARVELFLPGKNGTYVQTSIDNDEGKVVLQSDLGAGYAITIDEARPQSDVQGMIGRQWLTHDFTPDKSEVELRLKKWRPIEVRVGGEIQKFPAATLRPWITAVGLDLDKLGRTDLTEVLAEADGTRRFRGEVGGPMKLQIALRSALVRPSVQTVDIGDGTDLQTITLTSNR